MFLLGLPLPLKSVFFTNLQKDFSEIDWQGKMKLQKLLLGGKNKGRLL